MRARDVAGARLPRARHAEVTFAFPAVRDATIFCLCPVDAMAGRRGDLAAGSDRRFQVGDQLVA
jgi:hypothetical protein